ncbi:flagellar biosynthetic protein FliR [Anaplasmataceae bacterium AB001_6]|nr:flagellar biosynthetic protein FliR [Anaplasmataceae bacterium AB001_6]
MYNLLGYDFLLHVLLIVCRISSFILLIPISNYFSTKSKIIFATIFSFCVAGYINSSELIKTELILCIILELFNGLIIGSITYLAFSAIIFFGEVLSSQANVTSFMVLNNILDPQSTIMVKFFNWIVVAMFFASNTHILFLKVIIQSYDIIPIAQTKNMNDMMMFYCHNMDDIFAFGLKISAPIWLISLIFMFAVGILNRLVPQIQVFFVSLPLQIYILFIVLYFSLLSVMTYFREYYHNILEQTFLV